MASVIMLPAIFRYEQSARVPNPIARFSEVTSDRDDPTATFWSRFETYQASLNRIMQNPLVGVGLDERSTFADTGYRVHNILLGSWYGAGLFGMLGVVLLIMAVIRSGYVAICNADSEKEAHLCLALICSIGAFLLIGMSAPILFVRYGWLPGALLIALAGRRRVDAVPERRGMMPLYRKPSQFPSPSVESRRLADE
jgi:O-antigen ligase